LCGFCVTEWKKGERSKKGYGSRFQVGGEENGEAWEMR